MTDDMLLRKQAVAGVIRGVVKRTALIVSAVVVVILAAGLLRGSAERWWFLPASVLFGGVLGLMNFRWLAIAVERVYLRQGATPGLSNLAAIVISLLKLSLIFIVLFLVIKLQIFHVLGLVAGLSLCFLAILWEGVAVMKQNLGNGHK